MDWAAYDNIAGRYDEVWGSRFQAVARLLWERVSPASGAAVLDIGTGTGTLPHALGARASNLSSLTGCDRSIGMLQVARRRLPSLRLVAADASALPFRESAFDVATASFVLSHLSDYHAALAELRRVLKPGGVLAVTGWAAEEDERAKVWRGLLAAAVSRGDLEAAVARVTPSEACFQESAGVEHALARAGFAAVEVHALAVDSRLSVDQFLADRALSSGSRFARHALGPEGWARLVDRARNELAGRFGPAFTFGRGVLIGIGRRVP
jgi:ubiquinone/menaquinone biosynthesis C-methylase UbiE